MTYDLSRISNGDLNTIVSLRQHDEFLDLASELSKMTAGLNQRFSKIKKLTDDIIINAEATSPGNMDAPSRATLAQSLIDLRKAIEAFSL